MERGRVLKERKARLFFRAYARYVQKSRLFENVGGERLVERVVGMRRDQRLAEQKSAHDAGMVIISRGAPELYHVSEFERARLHFFGKGAVIRLLIRLP